MLKQIRQGDVFLVAVEVEPPQGLVSLRRVILAEGETTGHLHMLEANELLAWEVEGQRYIRVVGSQPGTIVHPDHDVVPAPVVAPKITYRITPQQEQGLQGQWRKVQD